VPDKKQECKFGKTTERRKGPGLKARVIAFLFEGPEGPCSLREYKNRIGLFHSLRVGGGGGLLMQGLQVLCGDRVFPQAVKARAPGGFSQGVGMASS
jgi:hypothetical protein